MKKICYGICGIGNGHLYRQLPILNYLTENHFKNYSQIKIQKVWVPYYIGSQNHDCIDFIKTAHLSHSSSNLYQMNLEAFSVAQSWLGKPDLVITDYEPFSAQYAYANESPLITFDQQSKYLLHAFPQKINGFSYQDEVMRLNMFFPLAKRVATSFFKPLKINQNDEKKVTLIAPFIRENLKVLFKQNKTTKNNNYLIYLSEQNSFNQPIEEIKSILEKRKEFFSLFLPHSLYEKAKQLNWSDNCMLYLHGNNMFDSILIDCNGIISTAGHSLLSEAMYLNKPVYALPLKIYEQQLNAMIIDKHHFGLQHHCLNDELLNKFINNIDKYQLNIKNDQAILLKDENSFDQMIELIMSYFK